jgi:Tfp pilus assembly PilM family ATPase
MVFLQEPNYFPDSGDNVTIFKGPLVTEIQQTLSSYVSQVKNHDLQPILRSPHLQL